MSVTSDCASYSSKSYNSSAVAALENNLQQSLTNLKDLGIEFELLYISSENYKSQFIEQREKCHSINCQSSEMLKKVIESKDKIIQLAASTLTKLNETRNFGIINDLFKILCGDTPKTSPIKVSAKVKQEPESLVYTPEQELPTSATDLSVKEESLLEIEGTPGRVSPIIPSKKLPAPINSSSDLRDKKKCPGNWSTPEKKAIKLSFPSPAKVKTRLKQSRLNLVKTKPSSVVDITSSPEFSGGSRVTRSESVGYVQPLIKKESIEDDTIFPSPTSGPTNFSNFYKTTSKSSPVKFKAPPLTPRVKIENDLKKCDIENNDISAIDMEESIKLLQPNRHKNDRKRKSPKKSQKCDEEATHCETLCEGNDSLSLLEQVKLLEKNKQENKQSCSPTKRPLEENKNITNIQEDDIHIDSSMSLLSRELKPTKVSPTDDKVKRRVPECVEPIYKEPTVRKKAEKRVLPGWSCDECKQFYAELYKDDLEMLAKKMDECSKHRGRNNPQRPKTPTGFWNPRWDVPDDTEEFNRRNNAV